MGLDVTDLCNKCGEPVTVIHFVTVCPAYSSCKYRTLCSYWLSSAELRTVPHIDSNKRSPVVHNGTANGLRAVILCIRKNYQKNVENVTQQAGSKFSKFDDSRFSGMEQSYCYTNCNDPQLTGTLFSKIEFIKKAD